MDARLSESVLCGLHETHIFGMLVIEEKKCLQ